MKSLDLGRYVLGGFAVAMLLAGCGGSQPPIVAPSAVAQGGAFSALTGRQALRAIGSVDRPSDRVGAAPEAPTYKVSGPLLYVSNYNTPPYALVTVYDATEDDPKPLAEINKDVYFPGGMCVDRDGTLYVTNESSGPGPGWVSEYSLGKTKPLKIIRKGINGPAFCAIDGSGNLWVTNFNVPDVAEYLKGTSKPHVTIKDGLTHADGIAIDHASNLYVGNGNFATGDSNIQVYSPGHKAPSRTIADGITWPVGIAVDPKGRLYVANAGTCNVEEYLSGQSHPNRTITKDIDGPTDIVFSKKGWMYEVNEGAQNCTSDGPWPVILEFPPGAVKPSRREVTAALNGPIGIAYYPPALP